MKAQHELTLTLFTLGDPGIPPHPGIECAGGVLNGLSSGTVPFPFHPVTSPPPATLTHAHTHRIPHHREVTFGMHASDTNAARS